MTDLEMIKDLERHAGFVMNRLTCDGNIYAQTIKLSVAYDAGYELSLAFLNLRKALTRISDDEKTAVAVRMNMNNFNADDWND